MKEEGFKIDLCGLYFKKGMKIGGRFLKNGNGIADYIVKYYPQYSNYKSFIATEDSEFTNKYNDFRFINTLKPFETT